MKSIKGNLLREAIFVIDPGIVIRLHKPIIMKENCM